MPREKIQKIFIYPYNNNKVGRILLMLFSLVKTTYVWKCPHRAVDPEPGGKNWKEKTEKCKEISNYRYLIKNVQVNLEQLHVFIFIFEPSFESFSTPENSS